MTNSRISQIKPMKNLAWVPCFDRFTCTKLEVPLDYKDDTAGTTHVAFMKWSSNQTSTNAHAAPQDILINPGGPGGSGIEWLLGDLSKIHAAIGTANNIVAFDPRAVNNSGPSVRCFPGEEYTYRYYNDLQIALDANDTKSYSEIYAKAAAFGDFCTNAHSSANDTAKYANTVATANDMLRYTELLAESKGQDPNESQLWFFGVSYGSMLGTTYASLFPGRVGRIVVDGIVDAEAYYQGSWANELVDADKAFHYFFQTCFSAGRNGSCAFWADSPAAIEARFDAVIEDLTLHPIPVALGAPSLFTISDFKKYMSRVPYRPMQTFSRFARVLVQLEQRNPLPLINFLEIVHGPGECTAPSDKDYESGVFIGCTDANGRNNLSTYDVWLDRANQFVETSKYMGEYWAAITEIQCHKLEIRAPESQVFDGYPGANQTSNPLLFVSTTIDPVTPLYAAEKMVKRFGGAGLLVQDSVGHSSISSPSECTRGYVRRYFETAELPEEGTHCAPDRVPFRDGSVAESGMLDGLEWRGLLGVL